MITEDQYLEAVKIINTYHDQVSNKIHHINLLTSNSETLFSWISDRNNHCSQRMYNSIRQITSRGENDIFINNISKKYLTSFRGVGDAVIKELLENGFVIKE